MELPKAFDTLSHDLMIAKLGAYGFKTDASRYIKSYLTNKKQRVRVNKTFNTVYTSGNNLNAGKCHFMYLGNNVENETFLFDKKHS